MKRSMLTTLLLTLAAVSAQTQDFSKASPLLSLNRMECAIALRSNARPSGWPHSQ